MKIFISLGGRVVCEAAILLPMSAGAAWGQLRDFRSSATHDPFHAEIQIDGQIPQANARLRILHRYLLKSSIRVGRILWWKEGVGFAFSDLDIKKTACAFPHVIRYSLESITDKSCKLTIKVGGKWTALGPHWIGRLWLWWVFSHVVRSVENQLLRYCVAMKFYSSSVKLPAI